METSVPDDSTGQLVTPAKAVTFQPEQQMDTTPPLSETESLTERPMGSPEKPLVKVSISAAAPNLTADAEHSLSSKQRKAARNKPSSSSSSDSISDEALTKQRKAVYPKRGRIKAWRYPGLQSSSSYRQLTTVGCCHQYTISGYALAKALGPGTRMCSDWFEAGGQQFRLEVYPAGISADASHHVSIFLTTTGGLNPNHVITEMAVLDQSGRSRHLVRSSKPRSGPAMMPQRGIIAGYPCFVRQALLDKHARRYLANDCLIVRATVEIVRSWSAAPEQLTMPGSMPASQEVGTPLLYASAEPQQGTTCVSAQQPFPVGTCMPAGMAVASLPGAGAAAYGRSDVSVCCGCPGCCQHGGCSSMQGVAAAAGLPAGSSMHGGAGMAAPVPAAEDSSAAAAPAAAAAAPAAVANTAGGSGTVSKQQQQQTAPEQPNTGHGSPMPAPSVAGCCQSSTSRQQVASNAPAQAAAQALTTAAAAGGGGSTECACIACLTAQLHQLQCALGLEPPGSPIARGFSTGPSAGYYCSPSKRGVVQIHGSTYGSPEAFASMGSPAAPGQLVYMAAPVAGGAPAAALPAYQSPPQYPQQQQVYRTMLMPGQALGYRPGSPAAIHQSPSGYVTAHYNSPTRFGMAASTAMGLQGVPHLAGFLDGVVDVQDINSDAGLLVPVARHHPVRVAYM